MVKGALVGLLFLSCVRVASSRADRDATIGQASSGELGVEVADGLAAVRSIGGESIHLWANAPELRITVRSPNVITLRIENVFADAEVLDAAGKIPIERPRPTEIVTHVGAGTFVVRGPDALDHTPYRFAMYADVQSAIDKVQDIYAVMNRDPKIRFALAAGDLTERGSVEQLERYQRELRTLAFPVFTTLGNHELGDSDVPYHDWFGRGSSSWEFRGVRFTLLDSASATLDPKVYDWLDDWLARGRDRLHVVSMHIAPLEPVGVRSGSFASRNEANKLLARLAAGSVDLTLYGHVHSYYAYSNAGIPAHISGGGGGIPERMDGIGRHFLVVDVDPVAQTHVTGLVRVD